MARLLLRDLTPGTNYKIQLRAVEGDSVSEWSRLFDLPTSSDTTAPDTPAWAVSNRWVVNGDTFVATWQALDFNLDQNKDFDHYEIEFGDGVTSAVIRTNNTSYTLTFDQNRILFGSPEATVTARVRAVDAVGNASAWSSLESATNPAPTAPATITATALYDSIKVSWASVADIDVTNYIVQVSTTSASSGFNTVYSGMDTEYVHDTTMFNTDHWYRVYAVDKFGSLSSATTSGAVRPKSSFSVDTTAPAAPTDLAATIANNANGIGARASLSWSQAIPAANDLAGFNVRWRKVGDTDYSQTSFSHEDRAGIIELQSAFQNYEFQIRSYDWMGNNSAWSATVTATSPANTAPAQVTGVASVAGRDSIRYTWTPSTAADLKEYEVTFSTSSTFASGNITFKTGNSAALTVSGLNPATTYYARVRAIDTSGLAGSWSATHTKATLAQLTPDDIGAPTDAEFNTAVKSYVNEYAVNTSETVAPTTGWSTATPTRNPGDYIWIRTVVTKQDNSTSTTNPALLTGNDGAPGADGSDGADGNDGAPGRGISGTSITYAKSTNGTTAPAAGSFGASIPTTTTGEFLWTKTVYTYTDATTDTAYSVAAHGATGAAGSDGADGKGITGTTVTYQKHTNGTTAPTGTWTSAIPATAPGEFLWTRTVTNYTDATNSTAYSVAAHGEAGSDGADGVGISNTVVNYAKHTNGTTAPTTGWGTSIPATVAGEFLWTRTVTNYTDTSTSTAYSVAAHGANGADGADGADGTDGRGISSTAVTYQVGTSGTTAPTGTWVSTPQATTAGQFLWTKTVTTYTDASTTTAYSVAAHGAQGPQGNTGAAGKGISSTEVRYQTHTNGTTAPTGTWSATPTATTTGQFLWTRTILTYTDATTSTAYAVSAHGSTGSTGAAGKGISSTTVTYQVGTSGTAAPTGTWLSSIPATAPGEFLWTKTYTVYTDATNTTSYSVAAHGTSGADGNDGADGVGISGTTVTYQKHTSGTTAPTGTWTTAIPATVAGEFLWTRTVTNFTDASSTTAYSVAAHGAQGPQGDTGAAGKGVSSSTTTYQAHTSGTTAPTGTWLSTVPSVPAGQFLWTRTILTYTDASTSPPVYSVAGAGSNGTNGVSVTAITRYWLRQTAGAGTPATPGNVASPGGSWTTTEPDYLAGTELWMMDRISYSNGTYAYTAPAKSSAYTAAVTAITAANGKNKIVFSTGAATGTAYSDGDIWYQKSGTDIIGVWEFVSGAWASRTLRDEVLKSLSVGKLAAGDIDAITVNIAASGVIKSTNYSAGSAGWKLDAAGLEINNGAVKASTLTAGTLGSSTGVIQIAAGASIVMNGGYIKSNTNTGTTFATAVTSGAGFYLGNDGLFIGSGGSVKAGALESDTLTSATITLGTAGVIQGGTWSLSSSGLSIPDGGIAAQKIVLQSSPNIMPPRQASWEGVATSYGDGKGYKINSGGVIANVNTSGGKFGSQKFGAVWGAQANPVSIYMGDSTTDYNIPVEGGKTYIFSLYAYSQYAQSNVLKVKWSNGTIVTVDTKTLAANDSHTGATRLFGAVTAPAGVTGAVMIWENPNTNVNGGVSLDGLQVEEKVSFSTSPSPWSPPGITSIDGGLIRTGAIQSTADAVDANGAVISGVKAWSINTTGQAVFGDVLIRGTMVMGVEGTEPPPPNEDEAEDMTGVSIMKSYNYQPGLAGWAIKSNGVAEFLQLAADSVSADAISAISPDKMNPGIITSDLFVGSSIRAIEQETLYVVSKSRNSNVATLTLSGPHRRLVGDRISVKLDQDVAVDTTFDTPGMTQVPITAVTETTISYANVGANVSTLTHDGTVEVEGRSVVVDPSGVTLLNNDGTTPVVDLPTNPLDPAYFAGNIEANSLTVIDDFLLQGPENYLSAGSVFTLNASVVAPASVPSADPSWTQVSTWFNNDFSSYKSGLLFDAGVYMTTSEFMGGASVLMTDENGAYIGNGSLPVTGAPAGITKIGSYYYALQGVGNPYADVRRPWKVQRYTRNANGDFVDAGGAWEYDESGHSFFNTTYVNWIAGGKWGDPASNMKRPVIGTNGTHIYIARCNLDGKFVVSWYTTGGSRQGIVRTGITNKQNLVGINVGTFDYGATRWIITTEGTGSSQARNYVTNTSGTHQTTETWLSPGSQNLWGTTWNGSKFVTLAKNHRLYWHSDIAKTGSTRWYVKSTWYDGNDSDTRSITARSGNGTTTTLTVGSGHPYGIGDTVYVAGTGTSLDNAYYTIDSVTSTQIVFSASYSGSGTTGGTVTNQWETSMSNYATVDLVRRADVTLSSTTVPGGSGANVPDRARFYIGTTTSTFYRQENTTATNQQKFTEMPTLSGATTTGTPFPAGTPAKIVSNNGLLEISSDGFVRTDRLVLKSTRDASTSAGNTPALMIGDDMATHLRIDNNEIIAMTGNSTQGTLNLNLGGVTKIPNADVGSFETGFTAKGDFMQFPNIPTVSSGANVNMNAGQNNRIRLVTSSQRFKENIHDAVIDTDTVMALRPRVFQRNDERDDVTGEVLPVTEDSPWYTGFIAEEAEALGLKGWVTYDADGKPHGFDYMSWTVVLQDIARKHNAQLASLEAEVERLRGLVG